MERQVQYARKDFFGGEDFGSLDEIRASAAVWCREHAGGRDHGTTGRHPLEHFESVERSVLLPAPEKRYDTPAWSTHTVRRDHTIRVGDSLYSVPFSFGTGPLQVRLDRQTVKMYSRRKLVKIHARVPAGESQLDPADAPPGRAAAVERTGESLFAQADGMSGEVGVYARRLAPDPKRMWSDIGRVYRLLHLCEEFGPEATTEASMIVTSNRTPEEWLDQLADRLHAQALVDRFQNNAYDLVIDGESYRKRQKPA